MKNLKKVLALGLALVMLLGMFTIASAAETEMVASDLTDWDTVEHKDAVSLMVDLGIIKGMPDGTFTPTGNIDRASWAKMVYFAATGSEDADAYLGTASGLGDIAGNWAESYISFLKANKYISGDENGNYNPSANVTVAEACKMMLTVLGYDAEDRGYQNNAAWSGNIMTDAKRNGLMDNVDSAQTALVPLTRENAAEIVLNALNANMVEGIPQWDNGNRYITQYNKLYTLGYDVFDMVKVTATISGIDKDGYATFSTIVEPEGFNVTTQISGKVKATANLIGEDVNVYVKADGFKWDEKTGEITDNGTFKNVISSSAAKADITPVKTITSGITRWADLTSRGTSNFVASYFADDCAYYLNGEAQAVTGTDTTKTGANAPSTITSAAGLRGTVVEFYTNDDGEISIVKAFKYKVGLVENGDATTKTLSDGTVQVRVPGVISSYVDSDKISGWQGLVDGDVVLYYETSLDGGTKAYTLEKADVVTGNVSSFNSSGELTVNGVKHKASEQTGVGGDVDVTEATFKTWTTSYNLVDEYEFYLDKGNYICYAKQVTETLDSSKVCLVIETEVLDKALGSSGSLRANLLFADGSTEIVTVSKVNKLTVTDSVVATEDAAKKINTSDADKILSGGTKQGDVLTKFFNWKSTSSGYELVELNKEQDQRNWEDPVTTGYGTSAVASIWKESTFVKAPSAKSGDSGMAVGGKNITANDSTVFIVGKTNSNDDTVAYSVYKGFRNVPEMDAAIVTAICAENNTTDYTKINTVAKYVYLETGTFKDDVPDGYIFIASNEYAIDPDLEDIYQVNIVDTDGTATTMRVDEYLAKAIGADSMVIGSSTNYVGKFFEVTEIDEDGVVTAIEEVKGLDTIVDMGDGVVTLTNSSCDYDSATKFIYVDMGWTDSLTNANSQPNVREDNIDEYKLDSSGTFNPNNFYDETDVSTSAADGTAFYSVQAVTIVPDNSTTADYVYVVRVLW